MAFAVPVLAALGGGSAVAGGAVAATAVGAGLSAYSSYKQGQANRRAATADARAAEKEAALAKLAGLETITDLIEERETARSTADTILAMRNVDPNSASYRAYNAAVDRDFHRAAARAGAGSLSAEAASLMRARQAKIARSSYGLIAGLDAVSALAKGAGAIYGAVGAGAAAPNTPQKSPQIRYGGFA